MTKTELAAGVLAEASKQLQEGRHMIAHDLLAAARILAQLEGRRAYDSLLPDLLACNEVLIQAYKAAGQPVPAGVKVLASGLPVGW